MHTVIETPNYLRDLKRCRISEEERDSILDFLSSNPDAGEEIPGTGGARKIRFPRKGQGKSGGYRVLTFYSGIDIPVFLLKMYAKNERANISAAERKDLKKSLGELAKEYRKHT